MVARSSEEEGRRREGKEGCGVRVRGDLRASLYVYHTAARPLPVRREREGSGRPRRRRRSNVVSGTVSPVSIVRGHVRLSWWSARPLPDVYSLVTPQTAETTPGPNDPVELICDYQGTRGRMLYEPITVPRPTTVWAHKRRAKRGAGVYIRA